MSDDREPLINARDERAVSGRRAPALPAETRESGRFGDRLRAWAQACAGDLEAVLLGDSARAVAAAIDQDATEVLAAYHDELLKIYEGEVVHARRRIDEAVERLRYSVTGVSTFAPGGCLIEAKHEPRDILDAGAFLAELDRIFGDRQADVAPWTWHRILALVAAEAGWKPERFVQEYGEDGFALERFLEAEEREREADAEEPEPPSAQVIDLMAALKASLERKP